MPNQQHAPDVRVRLRFLSTAEGGRRTLAYSNYRPQFFYNGHHYDANHTYPKEGIAPGDTTEAEITFLSPRLHQNRIYPGMTFEIYEGTQKVAEGEILQILALEKNAEGDKAKHPEPLSNKESWIGVAKSFSKYPDTQHWNERRAVLEPVITQVIQAGYDGLFRARTSMHDVLVFTSDDYRSPHITISVTKNRQIMIQSLPGIYSKGAVLAPSITSHIVGSAEAFPVLTRYLQHLWTETVSEPIPESLRKHQPKEAEQADC